MGFVHDGEVFLGKVIEQTRRTFSRLPAREMPGIVLHAGAGADLQEHVDVEQGAGLEALRLQQLPL